MIELRQASLEILAITDVQIKVGRVFQLFDDYQQGRVRLNTTAVLNSQNLDLPGRPIKPGLIPPLQVPKRKMEV